MSKLNFTRRTFLEKEEIARFQQFLADSPSENAIIGNTSRWGILRTDFQGDTDFLVEPSANAGRIKIEKPENRALTSEGLRIYQEAIDNIQIPNDNQWYWVRISHQYVNWEEGTVSVNQNGEVVGLNTKLLETLRGQGTQVPVKIKFAKLDGTTPINSGFYEIVDVVNDTNAVLTSAVEFQSESDLKVIVIGTTPTGETVTVEQEQGIYSYDNCNIELVLEETENEPPVIGFEENKTFYIARVKNNAGFIDVQDKRVDWWEFNVVGLTDKLSVFENLADLQNADTALINLGSTTVGRNIFKLSTPGGDGGYIKINTNGTISIFEAEDLASQMYLVNDIRYIRRSQNLLDLTDTAAARNNLNVYGKSEIYPLPIFQPIIKTISEEVSADLSAPTSIVFSQYGNLVVVSGEVWFSGSAGGTIFNVPSEIGNPINKSVAVAAQSSGNPALLFFQTNGTVTLTNAVSAGTRHHFNMSYVTNTF